MNKGIVMEISEKSIIVMRPDGKFDRVPKKNRSCEIGEEIDYAQVKGMDWRSPSIAGRSAIVAAVVFCLVLFASFNGKLGSPEVVAYVSMDINPSIEMGIDKDENVLELRGLNGDGQALIEAVEFKGKKLEAVTATLLDKAEQSALAKGEAEIIIASTTVSDNTAVSDTAIAEKVREQVTKHIQLTHPNQTSSYQVAAITAPQEVRAEADKNGVSMGKYTVYLNAKNNGTPVTIEELKKESVLKLSKEKPEVSKALEPGKLPDKAAIRALVEEEKSGKLDKKVEEKQKESKSNNGNKGNSNNNNSNNKNDPKKPSTPPSNNGKSGTSSGSGSSSDKKDDKKADNKDDKKDDDKDDKKTPPRPAVTPPSGKPANPGTTRPPSEKKDEDDDRKQEEAKKAEDERRREEARRLDEQKKKEEAAKKEQERKKEEEESKKDEPKKKEEPKKADSSERDEKKDGKDDKR